MAPISDSLRLVASGKYDAARAIHGDQMTHMNRPVSGKQLETSARRTNSLIDARASTLPLY
jgi:hypothetical protein